jgi:hemoglobin
MQNLYEEIGGEAAVNAAVDLFYKKVMADARVSPFFEGVDMPGRSRSRRTSSPMPLGGPIVTVA